MDELIKVLYKSIALFVILFVLTRITGKKHMAEITYYDYISGITLGAIAGASSVDAKIKTLNGFIAILVWTLIPIIISLINLKSVTSKRITGGKPMIVISNGTVNNRNLAKSRYTMEDLLVQLRKKDVFRLSEVEFAILEIDGDLSVLKKAPYGTVTPKDLNLAAPYKGLTLDVIVSGRIMESNLELTGKDKKWLEEQLKLRKVDEMADVIYAGFTSDQKLEIVTTDNFKK